MKQYKSIITGNFDTCYICKKPATDMHHILHGADKALSERYGLMIPLCRECHNRVHFYDGEYDRKLKKMAQREFLIKTFGKSYL